MKSLKRLEGEYSNLEHELTSVSGDARFLTNMRMANTIWQCVTFLGRHRVLEDFNENKKRAHRKIRL